jgi:gamma-glutamyl hydrolase
MNRSKAQVVFSFSVLLAIGTTLFMLPRILWLMTIPPQLETKPSPVIGIFTQPFYDPEYDIPPNHTMIAASYVKYLEAGGARSIPIPYDAPLELVEDLLTQVDGIFFPGGASDLPMSARHVWSLLYTEDGRMKKPIWGTCLGLEWILQLASGNTSILQSGFQATNISLPLEDIKQYMLYKNKRIYGIVNKFNTTMNNHHMGISPSAFQATPSLMKHFRMTSQNTDLDSNKFVSTIEPRQPNLFPVYGVQWHPEKNAFEYATYPHTNIPYEAIDHSPAGIHLSLYMASFFVQLVERYNASEQYTKPDTYPLVYDYPMKRGTKFEQIFIIPPSSHWEKTKHTKIHSPTPQ